MATCPECDAEIEIDDDAFEELQIGDVWDCDECGSRLRVATLDPLEFDAEDLDADEDDEKVVEKESDDLVEGELDDDEDKDDKDDWDE